MSRALDEHLEVLMRLRRRAGAEVYARALSAARVAVARVILAEAERLAGIRRPPRRGNVVRFPVVRNGKGPADS